MDSENGVRSARYGEKVLWGMAASLACACAGLFLGAPEEVSAAPPARQSPPRPLPPKGPPKRTPPVEGAVHWRNSHIHTPSTHFHWRNTDSHIRSSYWHENGSYVHDGSTAWVWSDDVPPWWRNRHWWNSDYHYMGSFSHRARSAYHHPDSSPIDDPLEDLEPEGEEGWGEHRGH